MKTNSSLILGMSLSVLLAAVAIAPARANFIETQLQAQAEPQTETEEVETEEVETEEVETEEVETETTEMEGTKGTIKSIAGSIVTVELEGGEVDHIWVSQVDLGRWNLTEGMQVLVSDGEIVGVSQSTVSAVQSSSLSSRTAAIWQELETSREVETSVPPSTTTTQTETTTYQVPEPAPEPVRALW